MVEEAGEGNLKEQHFGLIRITKDSTLFCRDDSSDEEGDASSEVGRKERSGGSKRTEDREPDIGKIVCVEISDKKKGKEPWFPGLIVAPTAQDAVSIRVKDEYLVRSFKDAR